MIFPFRSNNGINLSGGISAPSALRHRNRELEEHFETALENEEFEIWYQPKYSAHSRKLVACHAFL